MKQILMKLVESYLSWASNEREIKEIDAIRKKLAEKDASEGNQQKTK